MKLSIAAFKAFILLLIGAVIYGFDNIGFFNQIATKITILILVIFKTCYFMVQSYNKIKEATEKHLPYYIFLQFMGYNIALLMFSFGIDYFVINEGIPGSFVGVNNDCSALRRFFDFLYYSSLNMTNFGFGTLMPLGMTAKIVTSLEVMLSFAAIIFVLSDFMSLKESMKDKK
jgi:hypothetical protein